VTLTAASAAGSNFGGWSGDCTGTGSCQLAMSVARSVTATFVPVAAPDGGVPDGGAPPPSPGKSGGCSTGPAAIPIAAVMLLAMLAATRARRRGPSTHSEPVEKAPTP
jgi:uncharacterized protein (TIGR03382 family)